MDILIKSFNRPFYLDRCIFSIYKFVSGDFSIKVLDDGTPEKYLQFIQEKYPDAVIVRSENHAQKLKDVVENRSNRTEINGNQIPVKLWIDAAKKASDYFIITEDDVWFTEYLNINDLQKEAEKFGINLIKLGWLGNKTEDNHNGLSSLSGNLDSLRPENLFLGGKRVMEAFFYNHLKFFSLLYKLKMVDNHTKNKYWTLNSILMGLYKKEYWLEIWKDMEDVVDEKRQLVNASVYYKKNKDNPHFISRLKKEAMKTTFQSSATNSYHEYGYDFDVNTFNHIINEAWLKGEFDPLENFPRDFSFTYFEKVIKDEINVTEFRKWVAHFKTQYKNLGADVE